MIKSSQIINFGAAVLLIFMLAACAVAAPPPAITPLSLIPTASPSGSGEPVTIIPSSTSTPAYPWTDENVTVSGVCFESARDAAGRVFVLRSAVEHIHFYDQVDNSRLCRQSVIRTPFAFDGGRVLAGLWSAGFGCTARHDVVNMQRDDTARTFTITLRFITEGDCAYELVRPFWVGLDGVAEYTINLVVTQ